MKDRLREHKKKIREPLRQATLVFLLQHNQILLAMKKRGFAEGKWNGTGGKKNPNETIEKAAKREAGEEIGVTPKNLNKSAILNFYFLDKSDWNQQVIVFTIREWVGEPTESEEMRPQWFKIKNIPYNEMWEDDIFWLPQVLKGKLVKADFLFNENQKMIEKDVKEVTSL